MDAAQESAEVRRVRMSPEYFWWALKRRSRQLDVVPDATPRRLQRESRDDRARDLGPQMKARVALVSGSGFRPRDYPDIRPDAGDDGWISLWTLPELSIVHAFAAEFVGDASCERIQAAIESAKASASKSVQSLLADASNLGFDDRARCESILANLLEGSCLPSNETAIDLAVHDRCRLSAMLGLEPPWKYSPAPESYGQSVIRQLRERGFTDREVVEALRGTAFWEHPDVIPLRAQVAKTSQGSVEPEEGQVAEESTTLQEGENPQRAPTESPLPVNAGHASDSVVRAECKPHPVESAQVGTAGEVIPRPTLRDLCSTVGISNDTFRRIRESAGILVKERGGAARIRAYSADEVDRMIRAATRDHRLEAESIKLKWSMWGNEGGI